MIIQNQIFHASVVEILWLVPSLEGCNFKKFVPQTIKSYAYDLQFQLDSENYNLELKRIHITRSSVFIRTDQMATTTTTACH